MFQLRQASHPALSPGPSKRRVRLRSAYLADPTSFVSRLETVGFAFSSNRGRSVTEAAELSKRESPRSATDTVPVDVDAGAEPAASNVLSPEKPHFALRFLRARWLFAGSIS